MTTDYHHCLMCGRSFAGWTEDLAGHQSNGRPGPLHFHDVCPTCIKGNRKIPRSKAKLPTGVLAYHKDRTNQSPKRKTRPTTRADRANN